MSGREREKEGHLRHPLRSGPIGKGMITYAAGLEGSSRPGWGLIQRSPVPYIRRQLDRSPYLH